MRPCPSAFWPATYGSALRAAKLPVVTKFKRERAAMPIVQSVVCSLARSGTTKEGEPRNLAAVVVVEPRRQRGGLELWGEPFIVSGGRRPCNGCDAAVESLQNNLGDQVE